MKKPVVNKAAAVTNGDASSDSDDESSEDESSKKVTQKKSVAKKVPYCKSTSTQSTVVTRKK